MAMHRIFTVLSLCWLVASVRCEQPRNAAEVSVSRGEGSLPLSSLSSDHLLEALSLVSEARGRAHCAGAGVPAVSERLSELLPTLKGKPEDGLLLELQASVRAELAERLAAASPKVRRRGMHGWLVVMVASTGV